MGWNSWDCYAATVTEAQLLENAEYMRKYLLPFGWEYIVCDIQWYEPLAGTGEGEYRELWQSHVRPGCWPDCDMLPLGRIGVGFKTPRFTNFTHDEQITMMTLWCIFRSPLMMGGILPDNDDWTMSLLTNAEVLDVLKLGSCARQIRRDESGAVWMNSENPGRINLAFFNFDDREQTFRFPLKCIGMEGAKVRDLWAGKDLPPIMDEICANLNPHGAVLFRLCK